METENARQYTYIDVLCTQQIALTDLFYATDKHM